jgi:hypothetical protein
MATSVLDLGSASQPLRMPAGGDDINPDNKQEGDPEQKADAQGIDKKVRDALIQVRRMFKEQYAPKRRLYIRRALRAFEVLKNNPYILYNDNSADFDTLSSILSGNSASNDDLQLYQYNDNVYQMLGLAFIAALSPDVPKCRFQPVDAEDEEDILVAQKASTIQADNERRNGIKALQKLELLYLWCTGSYFTYTRNVVDKNRAGVTRQQITEMVDTMVIPNRYICKNCSGVLPEDQVSPFAVRQRCPDCKNLFEEDDYFEGYSMPVPTKTGEVEMPNSMTAMDVYCGLNVDADPDAKELYESGILDLEGETNVASVRTAFPDIYERLQQNDTGEDSTSEDTAKRARQMVTSPSGSNTVTSSANQGTYSRCWIQPWAFAILEDRAMAEQLTTLFPDGVKLVTYGEIFLQAVPERMMEHWTWCPTIKGLGLYPFGVGDAALDIQVRINDCANTVHAYMDRLAFGTIFFDVDVIDWDKIVSKPLNPGNGTPVSRKSDEGIDRPLNELVYQPDFHIDSKIFEYGPQLIQLAQVIAGVQPQTFGGSDPNIKTMGGQEQALKTAIGRMKLFWDQIREEHAARAECSVRCTINNMDDMLKITVGGELDDDYEQIQLLKNELTGDFLAYAESDEGFPSSYQEIQQRIMELMGMVAKNPFLGSILSDPDTQKVVARYLLPNGIKLPGDRERSRLKVMIKMLSKETAQVGPPGPNGQPVLIPSRPLNIEYDDPAMASILAKEWLQENWQLEDKPGFANVLALLTQANMLAAQKAAQQALLQQQNGDGDQGKAA